MKYNQQEKPYHVTVYNAPQTGKIVAMLIEMDSIFAVSDSIEAAKAELILMGLEYLKNNPAPERMSLQQILELIHFNKQEDNIISMGQYQF